MTETICPTCGAKCEIKWRIAQRCDDQTCKDLTHQGYNHKCPDLTKLREIYKDRECLLGPSYLSSHLRAAYLDLMKAVKELLEGNK